MNCFTLKNLTFSYPGQSQNALDDLSLSVEKGDFLILCGPSGCGKSTLLRHLKSALSPHGKRSGEILFEGRPLETLCERAQAQKIGYVFQSPENQIVTDKVWHELAFGLENLGYDTATARRRVAEMASFFGIENLFHASVFELSGGQKQLLSLASAMAAQPAALILDEPTAQLDPIAAADFLAILARINREFGTTVILAEHRPEEAFPHASKTAVMEDGRLLCCDTPQNAALALREKGHGMFLAMPAAMRVWAGLESALDCPVTVRDGSIFLSRYALCSAPVLPPQDAPPCFGESVIEADNIWFRYKRESQDVLKGFEFTLHRGEFFALLGGNGTGKTTALKVLGGLKSACRGDLRVRGTIGILPQNPLILFLKKSVGEDLSAALKNLPLSDQEGQERLACVCGLCEIQQVLERHPYDLSGGEAQRAALAKVLLARPDILLLDEPTKGLDPRFKKSFARILQKLLASGVSIFMVSHDVSFCAAYAHRCGLFFDGNIAASGTPRQFFSGNSFYTTPANRMARHILPDVVTVEQILSAFGKAPEETDACTENFQPLPSLPPSAPKGKPLPFWRRLLAGFFFAASAGIFIFAAKSTDLTQFITASEPTDAGKNRLWLGVLLTASLLGLILSVQKRPVPSVPPPVSEKRRRPANRRLPSAAMILLCAPLTLLAGMFYPGPRHYGLLSLLILLECMLPFFLVFEGRKPRAREVTVIAVLCAMGVAGRGAFFMLPQFKPVTALTILSGAAFGGETGFMVGAVTMLASNAAFSQGPWTPWQMFCMGIIGFLAGALFHKGLLGRSRLSLAIFGAISVIVIYGGIINPASLLIWSPEAWRWETVLAAYIAGFPMDLAHAAATALFLFAAADPMMEKLDRIKTKYGLIE